MVSLGMPDAEDDGDDDGDGGGDEGLLLTSRESAAFSPSRAWLGIGSGWCFSSSCVPPRPATTTCLQNWTTTTFVPVRLDLGSEESLPRLDAESGRRGPSSHGVGCQKRELDCFFAIENEGAEGRLPSSIRASDRDARPYPVCSPRRARWYSTGRTSPRPTCCFFFLWLFAVCQVILCPRIRPPAIALFFGILHRANPAKLAQNRSKRLDQAASRLTGGLTEDLELNF